MFFTPPKIAILFSVSRLFKIALALGIDNSTSSRKKPPPQTANLSESTRMKDSFDVTFLIGGLYT